MTIDPASPPPPPQSPPVRVAPWRRRARRGVIALGVVLACLALLCCAGVAYLGYATYGKQNAQSEMETFAKDLCRDLDKGDADAIYAALSEDARDRYSAQELADGLTALGHPTHCQVIHVTYLFLLAAYVIIQDLHGLHSFDLVEEAGKWKVDSDILHDLNSPSRHGRGGGGGGGD